MNQAGSTTNQVNPFANALLKEVDGSGVGDDKPEVNPNNLFSEALAKIGGELPQENLSETPGKELYNRQKDEKRRAELHNKVSPADQSEVFSAREEEVEKEINQLRLGIKKQVENKSNPVSRETEKTLMQEVVETGTSGVQHFTFFQIIKQDLSKSASWNNGMIQKQSKKVPKGPGAIQAARTKKVHDTFHNERSNAYSGG